MYCIYVPYSLWVNLVRIDFIILRVVQVKIIGPNNILLENMKVLYSSLLIP